MSNKVDLDLLVSTSKLACPYPSKAKGQRSIGCYRRRCCALRRDGRPAITCRPWFWRAQRVVNRDGRMDESCRNVPDRASKTGQLDKHHLGVKLAKEQNLMQRC